MGSAGTPCATSGTAATVASLWASPQTLSTSPALRGCSPGRHEPTLSASEDGCQINQQRCQVKKKKKSQKKAGRHLPNQQFSAGFPETLQAFKTKRGKETKPLLFHKHRKHSDEVQNSNLTSKAFLLASYPQILAQPTRKPVGSAFLLPEDGTQPAGV